MSNKTSRSSSIIESYRVYENKGIKFSVVDYRDPETKTRHHFVTTLPVTVSPETIAMLYYKEKVIEKKQHMNESIN